MLRTELCVILQMQYGKAVCRILFFLVYHENLETTSCFRTFFNVQSNFLHLF